MLFKTILYKEFTSIEREIDLLYKTYENVSTEQCIPFFDKKNMIEIYFGILYLLSSLSMLFVILNFYDKKKIGVKLTLIICLILYVWYPYESSGNINLHFDIKGYSDLKYYIYILHLFPYIFIIFDNIVIGEKVDVTDIVKIKKNNVHQDNLKDLNSLLNMGLITTEEFEQKKEFKIKEKIAADIKETDEYLLLKKSKDYNLLTESEFNDKIKILIDNKYKNLSE